MKESFCLHSNSFRILQMTSSVEDMGDVQWELAICLFIAWVMLYATVRKSVRWSGTVLFFLSYLLNTIFIFI